MGWRGVIRSIAAAERRYEREKQRHQRLLERQEKLQAKISEIESAALEVEQFEERIRQLTSIHREIGEAVSWESVRDQPEPIAPKRLNRHEAETKNKLISYRPGLFGKLFGKDKKKREALKKNILEARKQDDMNYKEAFKIYSECNEKWQESQHLAEAILSGQLNAYRDALEDLEPLSELQDMGCEIEINFPGRFLAEVVLEVESESIVPRESKSLTRTGRLSVKAIPNRKFYELYQDYVCGCALRAARELFSFLPIKLVIVNIQASILDAANGRVRPQTILSLALVGETLADMLFESVDPSDSMKLFVHRMGFKRGEGFFPINPLSKDEYPGV